MGDDRYEAQREAMFQRVLHHELARLLPKGEVNKSTGSGALPEPLLAILETLTVLPMTPLRARVEKGRLVLDEPTTLPEGTVVDLVADDEGDDLTDEERRALHEALSASWKSAESGRLRPASAIVDELRRSR
jgi:hypothetical protein